MEEAINLRTKTMVDSKNLVKLAMARYYLQQAHDLFEEGSRGRSDIKPLMNEIDATLPGVTAFLKADKTYEEAVYSYKFFQDLKEKLNPPDKYETITQTTNIERGYGI